MTSCLREQPLIYVSLLCLRGGIFPQAFLKTSYVFLTSARMVHVSVDTYYSPSKGCFLKSNPGASFWRPQRRHEEMQISGSDLPHSLIIKGPCPSDRSPHSIQLEQGG